MTFNFHLDVFVQEPRPPVCLFLLEAEPHITLPHLVFTSVLVNRQEEFDDEVVPVVCDFDGNFVVNCRSIRKLSRYYKLQMKRLHLRTCNPLREHRWQSL